MRTRASLLAAVALASAGVAAYADVCSVDYSLFADQVAAFDQFGFSVDLGGGILVVGCPNDDNGTSNTGSGYIFDAATGALLHKLVPADRKNHDQTGFAVGTDGDLVLLGAPNKAVGSVCSGAVYVFDANSGMELAQLAPSLPTSGASFGASVAIDGNFIVVGAPDFCVSRGEAYVFDSTTGVQLARLVTGGPSGNAFGRAVAITGTLAIITEPGGSTASVFDLLTGQVAHQLTPGEPSGFRSFGLGLAANGNLAVVGAPFGFDSLGVATGAAYVFDLTSGSLLQKLSPPGALDQDQVGAAVAIEGDLVAVGAPYSDTLDADAGLVHLFEGSTGKYLTEWSPSSPSANRRLGQSVALSAARIVLAAPDETVSGLSLAGVVYGDTLEFAAQMTRNGSGLNAVRLTNASLPRLGCPWTLDLDSSGHAASIAQLFILSGPSSGFFLSGGELLVDVSAPPLFVLTQAHMGSLEFLVIPVPSDCSLIGFPASTQAVILGAPGYELTNAIDIVLGL